MGPDPIADLRLPPAEESVLSDAIKIDSQAKGCKYALLLKTSDCIDGWREIPPCLSDLSEGLIHHFNAGTLNVVGPGARNVHSWRTLRKTNGSNVKLIRSSRSVSVEALGPTD